MSDITKQQFGHAGAMVRAQVWGMSFLYISTGMLVSAKGVGVEGTSLALSCAILQCLRLGVFDTLSLQFNWTI